MSKCEGFQVMLDDETADMMTRQFVAFDTETTGLDFRTDRIVELGAVLFENGIPIRSFSSLVNCGLYVRPSSQNVNHITNESLRSAPRESEAYRSFIEFLGPAARGEVLLCAHNAKCDFSFLMKAIVLGFWGFLKISPGAPSSYMPLSAKNRIRSEASWANSISCVTIIIVSLCLARRRITARTSPTIVGSKALVGSSIKSIFGAIIRARHIAIRCCCPPDKIFGKS